MPNNIVFSNNEAERLERVSLLRFVTPLRSVSGSEKVASESCLVSRYQISLTKTWKSTAEGQLLSVDAETAWFYH